MSIVHVRKGFGDQMPAYQGNLNFYVVDHGRELRRVREVLRRQELKQVGPVAPEFEALVLGALAPCAYLDHPRGVCPLGERHPVRHDETHNRILNAYYDHIRDQLVGVQTEPLSITWVAAGTDPSATEDAMTALGAEVWRDEFTDRFPDGPASQLSFRLQPNEGNYYLHEWGAWAGNASATPGSGLLVAHWLWSFNKTADYSLNGDYAISRML